MKAYKCADGSIQLFRPEENMKRLYASAERLSLPVRHFYKNLVVSWFISAHGNLINLIFFYFGWPYPIQPLETDFPIWLILRFVFTHWILFLFRLLTKKKCWNVLQNLCVSIRTGFQIATAVHYIFDQRLSVQRYYHYHFLDFQVILKGSKNWGEIRYLQFPTVFTCDINVHKY